MSRVNQYLVSLDGKAVTADRPTTERLLRENELLWLDLENPDADGLALLREVFGIHPLALEDIEEFGQRPKLEDFDDISYLVTYGAQGAGESLVEVQAEQRAAVPAVRHAEVAGWPAEAGDAAARRDGLAGVRRNRPAGHDTSG